MPTVRFSGRVIPSAFGVNVDHHPSFHWKDADCETMIAVQVRDDVVTIDCTVETFTMNDFFSLYRRAFDVARATIDLAAFGIGKALTVILEDFTNPEGQTRGIILNYPALQGLCTLFEANKPGFDDALKLVVLEPPLMWALRHLIEAIEQPNKAPVNCARSIETLRVQITPAGMDRKHGWQVLRNELQISEPYLRLITDTSTSWRHGEHTFLDGQVTMQIQVRAWTIMNRFLEYRRNGNKTLTRARFPMLAA